MTTIEELAKYFQKYAPLYGIKIISVPLAQCCKESGFFKSELAVNANNLLGIKYNPNQPNRCPTADGYYVKVGAEQDPITGQYSESTMLWQKFPTVEACVQGYFDFLFSNGNKRYLSLKECNTAEEYAAAIKTCGYATSIAYTSSLLNDYVYKYNLTQYDTVQEDTKPNIVRHISTNATTLKQARKIEYIVIHYTAGTTSKAGSAENTASYFERSGKASADFIVDDKTIVQYNGDILNRYTWHCGGNRYNTKGGSLYGTCMNANSIGVEICSSNSTGKVTSPNDCYWFYTQESLDQARQLINWLMSEYNIPVEKVVRHYDVTGKPCPAIVGWNADTSSEQAWLDFRNSLGSVAPVTTPKYWRVQVGAYSVYTNAELKRAEIIQKGYNAIVKKVDGLYKVQVGAFNNKNNAEQVQKTLTLLGFNAFITYS